MTRLDLSPWPDRTTVRSGAAEVAVESTGAGPPVVLLHAGVADRRSWRPLAPALAGDHHLVAWDRRGFGDTRVDHPAPHDHLDDLVAVMDAAEVDRAVVVGNSMGGGIAIDAALAHPDRVSGLVLVGAAWHGAPYPDDPAEVQAIGQAIGDADEAGDLDRVNELECRLWLDGPLADEGRVQGPARELFLDMNGRALRAGELGDARQHDPPWPRLASIDVPVAIVQGSLDEPSGLAVARIAATTFPNASLHVMDEVAHLPSLERPDELAAIVRDVTARAR